MILLLIIEISIFGSCTLFNPKQCTNYLIRSDTSIVLTKSNNQDYIWGLNLQFKGDWMDTAVVSITFGEEIYRSFFLFGKVDSLCHTDYYSDTCWLNIDIGQNSKLDLTLCYKFLD
jgi:hypothetical protein